MNRRTLLICILVFTCGTMVWAVTAQHRRLVSLRQERERLISRLNGGSETPDAASAIQVIANSPTVPSATASPELLQLRNEVSQLTRRRTELASTRSENERLLVQVAASRTNMSTPFPPGYIRRSEAQMMGYNSPESTLQSFLWAIRNRDITNIAQALIPEMSLQLHKRIQDSPQASERIFKDIEGLVGLSIVSKERLPDGTLTVRVQVTPDIPEQEIRFHQVGNEWKMEWLR